MHGQGRGRSDRARLRGGNVSAAVIGRWIQESNSTTTSWGCHTLRKRLVMAVTVHSNRRWRRRSFAPQRATQRKGRGGRNGSGCEWLSIWCRAGCVSVCRGYRRLACAYRRAPPRLRWQRRWRWSRGGILGRRIQALTINRGRAWGRGGRPASELRC